MEPTQPPVEPDVLVSDGADRPRRSRRVVVGLTTVALLAAGATGVALAADGGTVTPTPGASGAPSAGPEGQRGEGRGMHRGPGGPGMMGLMGAVHGELVVPKQGGGYQTVLVQRGTATAVSKDSISVKSDDGFTATYDVTSATVVRASSSGITSIKKNAKVVVMARKTSGGGTALSVVDLSALGAFHHDFDGDGPGRGPGRGPGGTATPSPGTTSGSSATGA